MPLSCTDCTEEIDHRRARHPNVTRCAECQARYRSTGRVNPPRHELVPDKTCTHCSAPFRPRGKTRYCPGCRYRCVECEAAKCPSLVPVTVGSPYCTRHARMLEEHGDVAWLSLPQTYPAEHQVWASAKNRCTNPRNVQYAEYGGNGRTVCPHIASFEGFISEVGPRPSPELSIERLNNDLGYLCAQCNGGVRQLTWATSVQQARNRRNSRTVLTEYAEPVADILQARAEAARYKGVTYKPARSKKGAGVFEAYRKGKYLGRAATADEAAELLKPRRRLVWVSAAA